MINEEDDTEIISYAEIFEAEIEDLNNDVVLPPQHRCTSHTLNLLATGDTKPALENSKYKTIFRSTFAKMTRLWAKQNQSTLVADYIKDELKVYLRTPVKTRYFGLDFSK